MPNTSCCAGPTGVVLFGCSRPAGIALFNSLPSSSACFGAELPFAAADKSSVLLPSSWWLDE